MTIDKGQETKDMEKKGCWTKGKGQLTRDLPVTRDMGQKNV